MKYLPDRNAARPGDDPIFALNKKAQARRALGAPVINATVGALLEDDSSLAVLPAVLEALRNVPALKASGYAPISGDPAYLQAIAKDLLGDSSLASMYTAVATPGGTGALRHALSVFTERGQSVLTSNFYWGPYATIADEHERVIDTFAMFGSDGGFDTAAFAAAIEKMATAQGRVLVFLNDPCHNPTGYSMSAAEWEQVRDTLVACSARVPTVVLADVAYLAFAKDTKGFLSYLEPIAENGVVLFAWSGSKGFALYGQRVGALIACTRDESARGAIGRAMSYACRGTWSNCNASAMDAVRACLTDPAMDARVRAERERLRGLLDTRVDAFNAAAAGKNLRYPRYDGGFFVTLFCGDPKGAMEKLEARDVFVVPGPGSLRVALCSVPAAEVDRLVSELNDCTV
ncbi:MAG: aminotransferase class I/II-fold pyridoxal phosphate-dependent enzyme [Deltaproteobacteria bacterium]|nr:aminotransferase class I/II-fold pyridoxal phosphate-dependent enzyme [Deltaproteobacteria bacterium]